MLPDLGVIITVIIAGLTLAAIPGPSMLYVLSISISQGTEAGLASSLGLALGGIIHAFLAAVGISILIARTPILLTAVQIAGAIYLLYLGIQIIRESNSSETSIELIEVKKQSIFQIFKQGILVELLNPKTILFFLAFLPQFITSNTENSSVYIFIVGLLVPLTAIPYDLIAVYSGPRLANKIVGSDSAQNIVKYISGGILILLSLYTLISAFTYK